jgi:ABC-type transport system substrate-binding protein
MLPFDQPADEHATNLIGTGAFVVEEIVPGERAILRRNENYWRMGADEQPLPYLDEVQLLVMPDRAAQIAGLQAGTLDLAQEIGFDSGRQRPQPGGCPLGTNSPASDLYGRDPAAVRRSARARRHALPGRSAGVA